MLDKEWYRCYTFKRKVSQMIALAFVSEESPSTIEQLYLITSSWGDPRKRATEINRQLTER